MGMEPTPLSKIALEIGPLSIRWYGIILGTAALVGLLLAIREGRRRGIHPDLFLDLILFAVPVAIICARAYYVIFEWGYYKEHPEEIVQVWRGGLAIHGALIGSVLTGWLFARYKKISFWGLADIAAPSIIMGQAIGRWGNFINQEAHGGEVSRSFLESLHLPDWLINQMYIDGSYYHPTFLYESLWNLLGFIILLAMRRLNPRRGELFIFYVIWYSIGRFFIEGMRTDSLMLTDSIRIAQLIGVVLVVLMLAIFFYRRKTGLANARYNDSIYLEQEDPKGE
jgi:phosphatidylglycerol:prolipoprotein diacylglycerol transferase